YSVTTQNYTLYLHDALPIYIAEQAEDDQRADREPQPLLEVGGLGEFRQADALRHLVGCGCHSCCVILETKNGGMRFEPPRRSYRSEEHTSELQSRRDLVCRL